jgi:hypothetical protein
MTRIVTRVIRGYSPCTNKNKDLGTVYQQHHLKDDTCPHAWFREDLLCHMKKWQKEGERLILCVDANKNTYQGELGRQLTDLDGLGIKEVVGEFTAKQVAATYFQGSKPIDGIWATGNLTVANACVVPVGFGVGDHQLFVIGFVTTTLVGLGLHTIICPALCRLNTKIKGCAQWYNKILQRNILRHRLLEGMVAAASSRESKEAVSAKLNMLDWEGGGIYETCQEEMLSAQVGKDPILPGSIVMDSPVPSFLVTLVVACQADKKLGEP